MLYKPISYSILIVFGLTNLSRVIGSTCLGDLKKLKIFETLEEIKIMSEYKFSKLLQKESKKMLLNTCTIEEDQNDKDKSIQKNS